RAADAAGGARHRPGRLRPVHRAAPPRSRRLLSRSAAVMTPVVAAAAGAVALSVAAAATAQAPRAAGEPLHAGPLQRAAGAAAARPGELGLLASQTDLRLRNLAAERLPAISTLGQSQFQSDVPTAPFSLPNGEPAFAPPKFTYDVSLRADQRLYDPSLAPRRALTEADLAESQARVRTSLFSLRQEGNEAFFTAALPPEQGRALGAPVDDPEGRLRETGTRVREGAALPGEAAAVEATLLRQRQQADELRANRVAALARLATLTARPIPDGAVTPVPDLAAAVANARA